MALSEGEFAYITREVEKYLHPTTAADLRAHDREQRAEIERLKGLNDSFTRQMNEIGQRLDEAEVYEDSYALCIAILTEQRNRLRDAARVRDARTEPPANDQRVLLFGRRLLFGLDGRFHESEWVIDWFLVEGDMRGWMWGRYPEDHLWLPLPPAPEAKP